MLGPVNTHCHPLRLPRSRRACESRAMNQDPARKGWRFAIDRGGTFTDVVAWDPDGRLHAHKVLSRDASHGGDPAVRGLGEVLERSGGVPATVDSVRLGTTVATNALLERKGE